MKFISIVVLAGLAGGLTYIILHYFGAPSWFSVIVAPSIIGWYIGRTI